MLCSMIVNGQPLPAEQSHVVVPWWSFTKPVLAAAALTLVRDGLVQLDEPLEDAQFTLRQLLKHQAGLADYSELKAYHAAVTDGQTPWPADEMMQRLDASRLRYTPGAGWRYSNVGYMLVARLIERVTGLCIDDALTQRVFIPLDVTGVQFANKPEDLADVYPPAIASYNPGWVYHGLLVGPLSQATRLLNRLLTEGLLPDSLLQEMQESFALGGPISGRPWAAPGYGLGLMIGKTNSGHLLVGHTGVGPGGVIAVYYCSNGSNQATCSVFAKGNDEGQVETQALDRLIAAVGPCQ
ncbi:serine hydrolase domain-containing protein [Pseudomonas sp. EL_65y_Pfl2_R95]|uniref:serine hydrolase domain-containing protein n=1 Tax=Pseudomonas sp. EL_65y_Pfl2_R95 TaxID=3088698 RepID=UPI0030DD478B